MAETFDPQKTPGTFGRPPVDAPYEVARAEDPVALAARVAEARRNERELAPLIAVPAPRPAVSPVAQRTATIVHPATSRLRVPGQQRPSITSTPVETTIILTDADSVAPIGRVNALQLPTTEGQPLDGVVAGSSPARVSTTPARPAIDPTTAAYLDSPVARAARALHDQRALTHQPAASDTDSPSRGIPAPSVDPGKTITGGFGDAGDALYFPLDGSELRELVRGLMSVIDAQITNDLRFSMAICYPRVTARVIVEIEAYNADATRVSGIRGATRAVDGDGSYDPSFSITKIAAHDKTPLAIARERANEVCFVVRADKVEMTATGESISPPNAIRAELGLVIPRKQAIVTPQGRLIVDLPA